ncbi:hypothetical protein ACVBEF_08010 [Glaciimonas sp. GG7]
MATNMSKDELVTFMVMNIAQQLSRLPSSINTMSSLSLQDVDSLALAELGIALQDLLGDIVEVERDIFWEHITIDAAAKHLSKQILRASEK